MKNGQLFSDSSPDSEEINRMRDYMMRKVNAIDKNVLDAISENDERIAIIIAVSYIEAIIEEILMKKFVQDKSNQFNPFKDGPLETLSAKLKMAHLMGIFSKKTYQLLTKIKNLRNDCAHQITLNFEKGQSQGDKLHDIHTIMQENVFYKLFIEIIEQPIDNKLFVVVKDGKIMRVSEDRIIVPFLCILIMFQIILDNVETIGYGKGSGLIVE